MLKVFSENSEMQDFPITSIHIISAGAIGHREILGSLIGLGLKRDVLGDIVLLSDTEAVVFIKKSIAAYIIENLSKIGKTSCTVSEKKSTFLSLPSPKTEKITITIASERLDCFVDAVTNLSREKSSTLVKDGKVFINQVNCQNPSAKIKIGDKISIRGFGKFVVEAAAGQSRKGKLRFQILKY